MNRKKAKLSSAATMPRLLIGSGVNLDLLGRREPHIYGVATLQDMEVLVKRRFGQRANLTFFQTNNEAEFLSTLSRGWDGAVLNPGAWTHTSLALCDRLAGLALPFVEVHLTNTAAREAIRHHSYVAPIAVGVVQGFGIDSYVLAVEGLLDFLARRRV